MSFRLEFETCNAAFGEPGDEEQFRAEVGRILGVVRRQATGRGADGGAIMDINGNKVGSWSLNPGCGCPAEPPDEVQAHDGTWWPNPRKGAK